MVGIGGGIVVVEEVLADDVISDRVGHGSQVGSHGGRIGLDIRSEGGKERGVE